MRTWNETILFTAVLAVAALAVAFDAQAAKTRSLTFDVGFGAPRIEEDADGLASVRLDRAGAHLAPGAPALPHRTIRLALPPDAELATVRATVEPIGIEAREGPLDVAPAPPARARDTGRALWGAAESRIDGGRDTAIYDSDALYPASWGAVVGAAEIRGFKSVAISLTPVRCRPLSGDLMAATALRVTVSYAAERVRTRPSRGCSLGDPLAARLLDNFAEAAPWYEKACALYPAPGDDGIAVITTDEIEEESLYLGDWIELRESQGYSVTVATDADFDVSTGDAAEDGRADRIRRWLKDNWEALELGWVLLVGNPDPSDSAINGIPMKPCARASDEGWQADPAPTDFYYANLTDDFDADGNGTYCEATDGLSFVPDVYVGRLPCYSAGAAAIDEMLARILAYEEESATGDLEWRRRVLLPDSIYWYKYEGGDTTVLRWDSATIGEWLIRTELEPRGMVWTALYERTGYQPSQFESHFPIDSWNIVNQWALGYGLVYWGGHGNEVGAYRTVWLDDVNGNTYMDYTEEEYWSPAFMLQSYSFMLEDAPPPFVVQDSCSNATPEVPENLAYNLLRRGAIATLATTRVAYAWNFPTEEPEVWEQSAVIEGDSSDMLTEYSQNVIAGSEAGRALGDTIAVTEDSSVGYPSLYQKSNVNLYGDPLLRLVMCRVGAECDDGSYCDGQEWCDDGTCMAGEPIVCAPTDECAEMVCDDDEAACVPGTSCVEDAGPDAATPVQDSGTDAAPHAATTGYGASSGCSAAPPDFATRSLLVSIL